MKVVKAGYIILTPKEQLINQSKMIEKAGRTCYKSEDMITDESHIKFVDKLLHTYHHESVIEHSSMTVVFVNDRGVSHEEVRHRLCAFSQESTRYINYTKENKGGECSFIDIKQHLKNPNVTLGIWMDAMQYAENAYKAMIDAGESPQIARSVLPNSLKTELVVTTNFREWRHIFKLRTSKAAHPQIREVMNPLLLELKSIVPVIFDDINPE